MTDFAKIIGWRKIYAYVAKEDFDVTFTDYGPWPEFKEEEISIQAKKGEDVRFLPMCPSKFFIH